MADFEYTFPDHIPLDISLFADAYDLFEELYADRLQLDPSVADQYLLDDLLLDDPQVLADFRYYTLTGILRTKLDDPGATTNHLEMFSGTDPCIIVAGTASMWVEDGSLASEGLSTSSCDDDDGDGVLPIDCEDAPEACDFRDLLEDLWNDSCLKWVDYVPDGYFSPGFDCDDYCEAFWAWLKHKQDAGDFPPDAEFEALWLYWRFTWGFGKGGKHWEGRTCRPDRQIWGLLLHCRHDLRDGFRAVPGGYAVRRY